MTKRAEVDAKDNRSWTPLHHAALWSHVGIAQLPLEKGAAVNGKREDGKTSLDLTKTDDMKALLRKYSAKYICAGGRGGDPRTAARKWTVQ